MVTEVCDTTTRTVILAITVLEISRKPWITINDASKFLQTWGTRHWEGRDYGNLGNAYYSLEDFQKAIDYHKRHLKISKEVGDRAGEGRAYCNLGNAYYSLGDFQKAIEYHKQHLKISKEVGDRAREGRAYCNLGNACHRLEDFQKAIECHERRLQISKDVGTRQEKEEFTVILARRITFLKISRNP